MMSFKLRLLTVVILCCASIAVSASQWETKLEWLEVRDLNSLVTGVVEKMPATPGHFYKKGEVLLEFNPRVIDTKLQSSEGNLQQARLAYEEAKKEKDRAQTLFDRTVLSLHELDMAQIKFIQAKSSMLQANHELEEAKLVKDYSVISAPFDCVVLENFVAPGQYVVNRLEAQRLLRVARTDLLLAVLELTIVEAGKLKLNDEVTVQIQQSRFKGRIGRIYHEVVNQKRRIDILVEVPDAGQMPLIGEDITVEF